jgi:predicted transglutaminase-like cysteine proteinase
LISDSQAKQLDAFGFMNGSAVSFGKSTAMPIGYYELCKGGHPVCRQTRGNVIVTQSGVVRLDARLAAQLVTVNAAVNGAIRPERNPRWRVAPAAGDCKDFALTKKSRLMSLGWPSGALLIATAYTRSGAEHAVLIVRTDQGDVVLDNLVKRLRPWSSAMYRWISIQSPAEVWSWVQVR